ncbi:MAG: hypothetical protein R6V44_13775 [Paracoccaceae bacterium]
MLQMEEIERQAKLLFEELGPSAIATAAQRASKLEAQGKDDAAEDWRRIERRLMERRGPSQA